MAHRRKHAAEHQSGGIDQLSVAGLSGVLATKQDADKLQGRSIDATAPTTNQVLKWNGTAWIPSAAPVTAHASTHQSGGSDQLNVGGLSGVLADKQDANKIQGRTVQNAAPNNGDVLVWNSTASEWQPVAGGSGTFGRGYCSVEAYDTSWASTTSTSFVEVTKLITGSLTAGTYHIEWYFEWHGSAADRRCKHRLQIDDTTTIGENTDWTGRGSGVTNDSYQVGGFKIVSLTAGIHNIDLDHCNYASGDTVYTRRARIALWGVS